MRTKRTKRTRHRRRRQLARRSQRRNRQLWLLPLMLVGLAAAALIIWLVFGLFFDSTEADSEEVACVELLEADKSGSQADQAVVDRWQGAAQEAIDRAAACEGRLIVETVHERPGQGQIREISFQIDDAVNSLDEQQKREEKIAEAEAVVSEILSTPAEDLPADLVGAFPAAAAHLEGIEGNPSVRFTYLTDGISSAPPVNMFELDLSPEGVGLLIELLRPEHLPDCTGWGVSFVGVNTTAGGGGIDPALASGAERFWRAYVLACGGDVISYDVATQSA